MAETTDHSKAWFVGQQLVRASVPMMEIPLAKRHHISTPKTPLVAQQKIQAHFTVARVVTAALFGDSFHGLSKRKPNAAFVINAPLEESSNLVKLTRFLKVLKNHLDAFVVQGWGFLFPLFRWIRLIIGIYA